MSASFTVQALEETVMQLVADLIGRRPEVDEPLLGQGLDSLAAMELRQKLWVCSAHTPEPHNATICVYFSFYFYLWKYGIVWGSTLNLIFRPSSGKFEKR